MFAVWAGACLFFSCLSGGSCFFCCLGRVHFFFAVWAGGMFFVSLFGRGTRVHSLTGLPGSSLRDPTTKKTKQQKKTRVPLSQGGMTHNTGVATDGEAHPCPTSIACQPGYVKPSHVRGDFKRGKSLNVTLANPVASFLSQTSTTTSTDQMTSEHILQATESSNDDLVVVISDFSAWLCLNLAGASC